MSVKNEKVSDAFNQLQNNENADLQYIVQALNNYSKMNFAFYTKENKFACISKIDQTLLLLSKEAFLMKVNDIYKETYNRTSILLSDLDGANESNVARLIRAKLDIIDKITNNPPHIQESGKIVDMDGVKVYNHYNIDKNILKLKDEIEFEPRLKDISEIKINKYKEIAFLIKYLTNDNENIALDYNTETSKYDKPVLLSQKFIHWLAGLVQTNDKLATSWVFQSKVQGVGKDLFFNEVLKHLVGKDFATTIDKETAIGKYNDAIDNKLLCVFNECEIESKKDKVLFNAKFKEMITESVLLITAKYKGQEYRTNFANFMVFCNADIPFHIEPNCRRNIVCRTPNIKLDAAVKQTFGIDMDEFVENIRKTRNEFIKDLLRFDFDMSFIYNKASMTQAKKAIIMRTNTLGSLVANLMMTNNQEDLRQFLFETTELETFDVDKICEETNAGFLSTESVNVLYEPLKGLDPDETSKTKKNAYFERLFSSKQCQITLELESGKKWVRCYKFPHYSQVLAENIYKTGSLEDGYVKALMTTNSIDFSGFTSEF